MKFLFLETQYRHRYAYMYEHSPYEYIRTHFIPMSTFKRLDRLYFEIHEVSHQEHLTVDEDVVYH
jgi:hypothetical protein